MTNGPDWIYGNEGREYYPFFIRNKVARLYEQLWSAVYANLLKHNGYLEENFKGLDWNDPNDHSKGATIRFKDGIGLKVTIELDHAPTITD